MRPLPHTPSQLRTQRGLSLIELMIATVIGLILLIGITALIVQQSSSRDELEKSSRQIENGRYATQLLYDDIEHAGYYGEFYNVPLPGSSVPSVSPVPALTGVPDPCSTSIANLTADISLAVQGYDYAPASPLSTAAAGASPLTCLNAANILSGTDILVVRRVDTTTHTVSDAQNLATSGAGGQVWLQGNTATYTVNTGAAATTTTFPLIFNTPAAPAAPLRKYLVHIYFISPCDVMANGATCQASDDNGSPIPTLKMVELTYNGANTIMSSTPTPLVEGIQNMQFDYGVDIDGDGYPDSYILAPASAAAWANVMAIRINLLAQNIDCTTAYKDTKTYNLGLAGTVSPPLSTCVNGDRKRHVFTATVRLINPSGRRAQQ